MEMFNKIVWAQIKLMRFAVLPGIFGGIACFVGPPHHALIKAWIGAVLGFAIQHHYMFPDIKKALKAADEPFDKIFDEEK